MGHLRYGRHFTLLGIFGILLCAMRQWRAPGGLSFAFAGYGALHAVALVAALPASGSLGRRCSFIALAAMLSAAIYLAGVAEGRLLESMFGSLGLRLALAAASIAGAAAYGIVIRIFWMPALDPGSIAAISLGCMLSAFGALFALKFAHAFGACWFALPWWFAFSAGLWRCDSRRRDGPLRGQHRQ